MTEGIHNSAQDEAAPNPHVVSVDQIIARVKLGDVQPQQETGFRTKKDAGAKARELLEKRSVARSVANFLTKLYIVISILAILAIAGGGYWVYQNRATGFLIDERQCHFKLPNYEVTGTRKYSYGFTEYFGWRVIDTKVITEETRIDVVGVGMLIVGNSAGDWWSTRIKDGERGTQLLKNFNSYTFIVDNAVGVVEYDKLCK